MKKRLLSALLALCMMLTMVPMAFATEGDSSGNSDVSAQAATNLPNVVDGVITLTENVTLTSMYTVEANTAVTIDLHGYTLSPAAEYSDRCLIKVSEGGNLTLIDSGSAGKITTNNKNGIRGISNNGTFTMKSGAIEVYSYAIENIVTKESYQNNQPVICNITGGELSASYAWTVLFMGAGVAGQSSGSNASIHTGENGSVRNDLMQVNISGNAKITGDQALTTNASNGIYAGFTLNISENAQISGGPNDDNCAIYLPAVGVTNISGGTISGNQGIRIAAGELHITGGTIEGTKKSNQEDLIAGGSGGTMGAIVVGKAGSGYVGDVLVNVDEGATVKNTAKDEGDKAAIVVSDKFMNDTSNGYDDLSITVNVNGATVEGNVVKVSNLKPGGSSDGGNTSLVLNNANITGNIINQTTAGDLSIVGGTITGNVENRSSGDLVIRDSATINGSVSNTGTDKGSVAIIGSKVTSAISDESDNNITIIDSVINGTDTTTDDVVALIGAKPYENLDSAISAAQPGDTIELRKDITNVTGGAGNTQGKFKIEKNLTLNGNGHTIKAVNGFVPQTSMFNIVNKADVTITNLRIDSNELAKHGLNIHNAGEVTLNNVEIINGRATAITNNGSKVTATGLKTSDNAWGAVNVDNGGTFTLVSGTLNEPSQIWSEDADDNEGSKITVPGGWTEVTVNKLDGKKEDVKTHYTTDIKKLGEAYNEDTKTVYDTVGRALSAAKNGETVQVINTSEVTGETVPEGVTLQVNSGVTLSGSLTNSGTIVNNGTITASITNNGNGEMTSEIRFSVSPNDAEVTVYDSTGDKVTGSGNTYRLANGNYRYTVSADGYYSESDNFTVNNEADTIFVTLKERSSSSSGGSSSSSNRYTVSVDSDIDNGSISVSPSRAERGDTVTITIDPEEGYELDSLTVRDSRGNRIDVERQSDTRYTFEMPSGRVTVDASFTEVAETPETPDQIGSFTDVDTDDWFADAVQYMLYNGMMNGVTDTTFGPGTTTTRGMIVTILYRLEGEPDTTASSFTDAASGMYYADAVAWAQANSIVTGITETIFAPDQAITREQMAAILYRYAQYKGYDVTASNDLSSYTDASRISAYATTAMQWANAEGLITGNTSTTINPTGNATRAEVATILMRFCETVTK